jgi:hypothetical protein
MREGVGGPPKAILRKYRYFDYGGVMFMLCRNKMGTIVSIWFSNGCKMWMFFIRTDIGNMFEQQ